MTYLEYAYFENWGTKQETREQYATVPPAINGTNSENLSLLLLHQLPVYEGNDKENL
jgi:hypothetical protein